MPQLSCQNLCLGYEGKSVVSGLSFSVERGDYLCIVGENGSGKSTLMKTILRLKAPLSGEIQMGDGMAREAIGYLPQQTAVQRDFPTCVRELVRSGSLNRRKIRPFYSRAEKKMAEENMEKLGISQLARQSYRKLSGGQQQRVLLARALCATDKMLLLDEPVSGLDPKGAAELYACIEALNQKGTTIIMISHDIEAALQYATHILHIGNGEALFAGSKAAYLKSDVGRVYAGGKFTQAKPPIGDGRGGAEA